MNHPHLLAPERVLMTTDTVGGVWTYAVELCRALAEHDVQVLLATMGRRPSVDQREEIQMLENVVVTESEFKLEWMAEPWRDVDAAAKWLLKLERRFHPDVVHLNGYAHGAIPFRAPKMVVAHSCVLSWFRAVRGREAPAAEWREYTTRVRQGLRGADMVVAPTQAMLAALERHYELLPHAEVIRNGRDPGRFTAGEKEPLVLSAGRIWDEAKNLSTLAAVAPTLPWPVIVAGECISPEGRELKLENVGLIGRLSEREMAALYARAAIYALPACYEPFGLSVLEAALSGCALVLGDIPSLRELWNNAAVFVPPTEAGALRNGIAELCANGERRSQLAALARERALEMTAEAMGEAYLGAYSDVMMVRSPIGRELLQKRAQERAAGAPDLESSMFSLIATALTGLAHERKAPLERTA